MRKNEKQTKVTQQNTISKSNELSLSTLHAGLTLQQLQLLSYAIYCTQHKGQTSFYKHEFEKFFGLYKYPTKSAKEDVRKLMKMDVGVKDYGERGFLMFNVFIRISYLDGRFDFHWTEDMLPHILELKERFILLDLAVTSRFTSNFSWRLYEFLKAKYGYYRQMFTKEELMELFFVQDVRSYQNTANFKKKVLDKAIEEINQHTEFELYYEEQFKGRKVIGFTLIWSRGIAVAMASEKQLKELTSYIQLISQDAMYIADMSDKTQQKALKELKRVKEIKTLIEDKNVLEETYIPLQRELKSLFKNFQSYIQTL